MKNFTKNPVNFILLKPEKIDYINKLLFDKNGQLKVLPYKTYSDITSNQRRLFALFNGIYSFPTIELVEWIIKNYDTNKMIEIGSGHGALARYLKIPATDWKLQENRHIKKMYKLMSQPTIKYPADVEKLEALEAIEKYKPDTVIACWVSSKYNPSKPKLGGVFNGLDEFKLLKKVKNYVFIGNKEVHSKKEILSIKHKTIMPEFLVSRAIQTDKEVIYTWEN
jgi:hypothetical protein